MIVYVYAQNGKIKIHPHDDKINKIHGEMITDGWVHTGTIDPIAFIEHQHNNDGLFKFLSQKPT